MAAQGRQVPRESAHRRCARTVLSLRTITTGRWGASAMLSRASQASPPVRAPSPTTATICRSVSPASAPALAMPSAYDRAADAWECSIWSCADSSRLGYPDRPPRCRRPVNSPARPVTILWTYAWCPTSHSSRSRGESKTRCSARVSSTTPGLGPRCPPVAATCRIRNSRIFPASRSSSGRHSPLRSAGRLIRASRLMPLLLPRCRCSFLDAAVPSADAQWASNAHRTNRRSDLCDDVAVTTVDPGEAGGRRSRGSRRPHIRTWARWQ